MKRQQFFFCFSPFVANVNYYSLKLHYTYVLLSGADPGKGKHDLLEYLSREDTLIVVLNCKRNLGISLC